MSSVTFSFKTECKSEADAVVARLYRTNFSNLTIKPIVPPSYSIPNKPYENTDVPERILYKIDYQSKDDVVVKSFLGLL